MCNGYTSHLQSEYIIIVEKYILQSHEYYGRDLVLDQDGGIVRC
jgi:hypothetical protein